MIIDLTGSTLATQLIEPVGTDNYGCDVCKKEGCCDDCFDGKWNDCGDFALTPMEEWVKFRDSHEAWVNYEAWSKSNNGVTPNERNARSRPAATEVVKSALLDKHMRFVMKDAIADNEQIGRQVADCIDEFAYRAGNPNLLATRIAELHYGCNND